MTFNAYMHDRNIYKNQPDFAKLASDFPEFRKYTVLDGKGQKLRVDFSNTEALRVLTKILLKKDFNLDIEIPEGFLIPTVPQRLNYILWLEDLLSIIRQDKPDKSSIKGIDIGTGACAIFSVLGAKKNGWQFIATESSDDAIIWAEKNITRNNLQEYITVTKVNQGSSLDEVLSSNVDHFDFCMCNPPFFENSEEIRKKHAHSNETIADVAQKDEIFVKGGEIDFVRNILKDSLIHKNRISIFTSMFGKKKSYLQILKDLKEISDAKFTSTEFCQGNTIRWGVAWTFNQSFELHQEVKKRVKPKKAKPPLEYQIVVKDTKNFILDTAVKQATDYLKSLEIHLTVVRSSQNFTELLLKSDRNTWTHQRRKRRELERHKKESNNAVETLPTVTSNENIKSPIKEGESSADSVKNKNGTNVHVPTKTDSVMKDCNIDIQITSTENQEPSSSLISDAIPSENISSALESQSDTTFKSECTKSPVPLQNKKKKLDLDSDESSIHKKIKVEKTETDLIEQNMADSKDEKMSIDDTDTKAILSNKGDVNPSSEAENEKKSGKISEMEDNHVEDVQPEGSVLHCYLQFINGKSKIYVKMNCPPSADRNTMYQVFQLIKNKINNF